MCEEQYKVQCFSVLLSRKYTRFLPHIHYGVQCKCGVTEMALERIGALLISWFLSFLCPESVLNVSPEQNLFDMFDQNLTPCVRHGELALKDTKNNGHCVQIQQPIEHLWLSIELVGFNNQTMNSDCWD